MDRVTRNLIFSIPHHATPHEVISGDGTYYAVQMSSRQAEKDPYWINETSKQMSGKEENEISSPSAYIAIKAVPESPEESTLSNSESMSVLQEKKATPSTAEWTDSSAENPDMWMPPPDRDPKLGLMRQEYSYGIWAYKEEKNPSKLFSSTDHEMESTLVKTDISPEKIKELEEERKDIIRKQIVKKRSAMAEKWHSMEDLYSGSTSSPGKYNATSRETRGSYNTGFALCFDEPSSLQIDTPTNSENIDTEQINFTAAREQFMKLEMENQIALPSPKQQLRNPRVVTLTRNSYERNWQTPEGQPSAALDGPKGDCYRVADTYDSLPKAAPMRYEVYALQNNTRSVAEPGSRATTEGLKKHSLVTTSREDLDSGLGEMPLENSTGYASDGSTSHELFDSTQELGIYSAEQQFLSETPIEREIRLALEREEDLRRERGILRPPDTEDLMEIPKKPLLSLASPSSPSWKARDKWRADIFLQREIEREAKREDDLKNEGKVMGMYDKGMVQELGERRKLFEQQDEVPVLPFKTTLPKKADLEGPEWEGGVHLKENVMQHFNRAERRNLDTRFEPYQSFSTKATAEPSSYEASFMPSKQTSEHFVESPPLSSSRMREDPSGGAGRESASRSAEKVFLRKDHFCLRPWTPKFTVTPKQEWPRVSQQKNEQEKAVFQIDRSNHQPKTSFMAAQERPNGFVKEKEPGGTSIVYKEYFRLQPWKPSLRVKEVEREDSPQTGSQQENLFLQQENFRLKPSKLHRSSLIEKEIQEALQREEELQEHRRRRTLLPKSISAHSDFDSSCVDGPPSWHSDSSGVSGSYLVSQSPVSPYPQLQKAVSASSDPSLPSEYSSPACVFSPGPFPNTSWERSSAAGPGSPQSVSENQLQDAETRPGKHSMEICIVESTRVNRHKNAMALRWEAGLFANKNV
ncbi:A-kinase anchor protein 2-like isoform X2 [Rhinatrema bivittatum]|uniref:A-kinase anchor protein 2-like isoform X2 n=1 Tax=Rhinatrema bivittatum TaxID=194408 RepID=UPI0011296949|nr:A-kinase anchor protein 2-like isoform X2 [Rhinatrema bivittatum]